MIGIGLAAFGVAWAADSLFGWTGLIALTVATMVLPVAVSALMTLRSDRA